MYCISETQIDFILDDISARGVKMVSLQQDLVDHICCIIEQNLEEDGDFEAFYFVTISKFYNRELSEIEEETINLLIHKNYYTMKKIMLVSGSIAASFLSLGILFKFMHWPGAAVIIFIGVLLFSFAFLPLLFVLKAKEKSTVKDKIVLALGALSAVSISLGVLFKIMHWPLANALCLVALFIMMFLFLPIYFFSGIKNPDTRVNTIVSSVIIVAGSALILTLVRSPYASKKIYAENTRTILINEQILKNEYQLAILHEVSLSEDVKKSSDLLYSFCQDLKEMVFQKEIGQTDLVQNSDNPTLFIGEGSFIDYIAPSSLSELEKRVVDYNSKLSPNQQKIPIANVLLSQGKTKIELALNDLIQIQMIVLQNQRLKS